MAISFRFSSYDFRLFDFLKRVTETSDTQENDAKPPVDFNPEHAHMMFDALNGSMMLDGIKHSYENLENNPINVVKDNPGEVIDENTEVSGNRKDKLGERLKFTEEEKTIRRKWRQQYREYKREFSINFQYKLSRADSQIDEIYLNKHLRDIQQHNTEESKNTEKQKDLSEKQEQIRAELRRADMKK